MLNVDIYDESWRSKIVTARINAQSVVGLSLCKVIPLDVIGRDTRFVRGRVIKCALDIRDLYLHC